MKIGDEIEHNGIRAVLAEGMYCQHCCFVKMDDCPKIADTEILECCFAKGIFKLNTEEQ